MRKFYSNISKRGPKSFHLKYLLSQIADKWSGKNSVARIVLKEQRCSSVMSYRNQSKRERKGDDSRARLCPCLPRGTKHRVCSCCRVPQTITDNHRETHTHQQTSGPKSLAPSYTLTAPIHHLSQSSRLLLPLSPSLPLHPQTSYLMWMLSSMAKTICSSKAEAEVRPTSCTDIHISSYWGKGRQADLRRHVLQKIPAKKQGN